MEREPVQLSIPFGSEEIPPEQPKRTIVKRKKEMTGDDYKKARAKIVNECDKKTSEVNTQIRQVTHRLQELEKAKGLIDAERRKRLSLLKEKFENTSS